MDECKSLAGGMYTSDLVKGQCTHLVASNTSSSKFKHASKWQGRRYPGLPIVVFSPQPLGCN